MPTPCCVSRRWHRIGPLSRNRFPATSMADCSRGWVAPNYGEPDKEQAVTLARMLAAQKEDQRCQDLRNEMDQNEHSRCSETKQGLLARAALMDGAVQVYSPFILRQDLVRLKHNVVRAGHLRRHPDVRLHQAPLLLGDHGRGRVRLGGQLCVLCQEQDCTKATHGDAQAVPGDGSLREAVYGHSLTTDRDQDRERLPPDHRLPVREAVTNRPPGWHHCDGRLIGVFLGLDGPPGTVLTDNRPLFASLFFQGVSNLMGIRNLYTSTYHPQTTGHVELFNKTLVDMFMHYIEHNQDN